MTTTVPSVADMTKVLARLAALEAAVAALSKPVDGGTV